MTRITRIFPNLNSHQTFSLLSLFVFICVYPQLKIDSSHPDSFTAENPIMMMFRRNWKSWTEIDNGIKSAQKNMPCISYPANTRLLLFVALSILISGCGTTMSPVKRKPLEISPFQLAIASSPETNFIQFESTLPGKPLNETVWDNESGAFADVEESKQIGFTQDDSKLIPAAAIGGVPAAIAVGTQPDYTRIVIPFGRLFEGVFESGLQKAFPKSLVCSDDASDYEKLSAIKPKHIIKLQVTEFKVWEAPLNHINLKVTVECSVFQAGKSGQLEYVYEARHEVINQSLGSMMTTSSGFIKKMNTILNTFTETLSEDILERLQKNLQG